MIPIIIDVVLLLYTIYLWARLEAKRRTIVVSQDPNVTYWNHVYISPEEDASIKLQAIIDFHSKRGGGLAQLSSDTYTLVKGLAFGVGKHVTLQGSDSSTSKKTREEV